MRKKKGQVPQSELFASAVRYRWKSVRELKKHDLVVVGQEEVKVASIEQEGSEWSIVYGGGATNPRLEQLYHDHDSVYARVESDKQA